MPKIRLHRPDGSELAPAAIVESTDEGLAVVLESAGGASSGDYPVALRTILAALSDLGAAIADAYVDSRHVQSLGLDRNAVRLDLRGKRSYPLELGHELDLDDLAQALGAAQAPIGRPQGAAGGGNRNKRIRILIAAGGPSQDALVARLAAREDREGAEKQPLLDEICDALQIPRMANSRGGTVKAESLDIIAARVGLNPEELASNPERVKAILSAVGQPFDAATDTSRGNTVTREALLKMRRGLRELASRGLLLRAEEIKALETPTVDENLAEARGLALAARPRPSSPPDGQRNPRSSTAQRTVIERDPQVIAWVLQESEGVCELCGETAPFCRSSGEPFLEVHHVRPLGRGGSDTVKNAVALCPNCHRACHYSGDRHSLVDFLYSRVSRLERE